MKHEIYILVLIVIIFIIVYFMMVYNARKDGRTFHEDLLGSMYRDVFPEEEFYSNKQSYWDEVAKGQKLASQETLYIGGLAYNLSKEQISLLEGRINYCSQGWKQVKVFIYGLDSKEPFRTHLIQWSLRDPKVTLIPKLEQSWKDVIVFTKMSKLRNTLHHAVLKEIQAQTLADKTNKTFFLSIDADIGGPISRDGLFHARAALEDPSIGIVYANGIVSDSFVNTIPGLRGWCFVGIGYCYYDDLALIVEDEDESKLYKWYHMSYGRAGPLIPVISAYGGAGLMKPSVLTKASYDEKATSCEHHSFNKKVTQQGYDIVVDPSFLLLAGCQGHHLTRKID